MNPHLTWKQWISVGTVSLLVGGVAFLGLVQWQHWRLDEENLHTLVQIVNTNLQQGKLVGLPGPPAPAAAAAPAAQAAPTAPASPAAPVASPAPPTPPKK